MQYVIKKPGSPPKYMKLHGLTPVWGSKAEAAKYSQMPLAHEIVGKLFPAENPKPTVVLV